MGLTKMQQSIWQKARAAGSGGQATGLSDAMSAYLVGNIVHDLGLAKNFPEIPKNLVQFFSDQSFDSQVLDGVAAGEIFERLVGLDSDADMYFACLATLHKARIKYETILETQPIPTLEQVGPRGLLQYGKLSANALSAFLVWRKWFFDIDNRSGQETGYLFEPVIASAIGGTPIPAGKSPVRRRHDPRKGRQIDCLREKTAYELKIRVTLAASGQGRWREELDFPADCSASGYTPVLVVLDRTPNPKLTELSEAFQSQGGEAYIGPAAWSHLDSLAGRTMSVFLDKYIRKPLIHLIEETTETLPAMTAKMDADTIAIEIGNETLRFTRRPNPELADNSESMPDDVSDVTPS